MNREKTAGRKPGQGAEGTQYSDVDVKCPCFKSANDKKKTVICEGAVEGTRIRFSLRQRKRYEAYRRTYCEDAYGRCPYYRAVDESYD